MVYNNYGVHIQIFGLHFLPQLRNSAAGISQPGKVCNLSTLSERAEMESEGKQSFFCAV